MLNKNVHFEAPVSQFPRNIYAGSPIGASHTQPKRYPETGVVNYPRDPQIDYTMFVDRDTHPENFSRFGYPWCPNGYCTGNHPGRYNTPELMQWQSNSETWPKDLAPRRFYSADGDADPDYCDSEAYITSRWARQHR